MTPEESPVLQEASDTTRPVDKYMAVRAEVAYGVKLKVALERHDLNKGTYYYFLEKETAGALVQRPAS